MFSSQTYELQNVTPFQLLVLVTLSSLFLCVAKTNEAIVAHKKALKAYDKLEEEEERCKTEMASCDTRDVRARQVRTNYHTGCDICYWCWGEEFARLSVEWQWNNSGIIITHHIA